jgi:energy-converting hydrogenase A subunit M
VDEFDDATVLLCKLHEEVEYIKHLFEDRRLLEKKTKRSWLLDKIAAFSQSI